MTTHPSSLTLESLAVGEAIPATQAAHVEGCAACAAFVDKLRAAVAGGPSAEAAEAAVTRALARPRDAAGAVADRRSPARAQQARRFLRAGTVLAPLAAAAALLVLLRGSTAPPRAVTTGEAPAPSEPAPLFVQMGTRPEPDTQFKGGVQLAVIRERGGKQERFGDAVRVRPGDRLRVEVALDREQAILGAVLADDGSYLELMAPETRGPGTHFSERSARIDTAVTRGVILLGPPDAVGRARATHDFTGVRSLRVEWEGP